MGEAGGISPQVRRLLPPSDTQGVVRLSTPQLYLFIQLFIGHMLGAKTLFLDAFTRTVVTGICAVFHISGTGKDFSVYPTFSFPQPSQVILPKSCAVSLQTPPLITPCLDVSEKLKGLLLPPTVTFSTAAKANLENPAPWAGRIAQWLRSTYGSCRGQAFHFQTHMVAHSHPSSGSRGADTALF